MEALAAEEKEEDHLPRLTARLEPPILAVVEAVLIINPEPPAAPAAPVSSWFVGAIEKG